jgi:membrane protease subunit (stomatin/prohibitin family)
VNYVFPSARMKAPLSVGMEVPVKISATDPEAVAVQWDALKGSIAASGGDMAAVTQGLANTYQGTADAAGRAYLAGQAAGQQQAAEPKPAEAAADPAKRLEKAQQLLDAGLISAEEFEAKRQEILGSL